MKSTVIEDTQPVAWDGEFNRQAQLLATSELSASGVVAPHVTDAICCAAYALGLYPLTLVARVDALYPDSRAGSEVALAFHELARQIAKGSADEAELLAALRVNKAKFAALLSAGLA